jgi:hypothetical protein
MVIIFVSIYYQDRAFETGQRFSADNEYYKRLLNLKDSPGGKKRTVTTARGGCLPVVLRTEKSARTMDGDNR